jgi:hypothetical protein
VTLKKRLQFLLSAMGYAAASGTGLRRDQVPEMKWLRLKDDGEHGLEYLTLVEYKRLRSELQERGRRYCDLAFWTGMHLSDLFRARMCHLEPTYVWADAKGEEIHRGRWWRVNTKNRRAIDAWMPMEPEFQVIATEWAAMGWSADTLITGEMSNLCTRITNAAKRAGITQPVKRNLTFRRSHATLLASRGYVPEYIRAILAHEGEMQVTVQDELVRVKTARPTTATRHYLRPSDDLLKNSVKQRNSM